MRFALPLLIAVAMIAGPAAVLAADATAEIALKNHRFVPQTLSIPANQRVKLTVKNLDATPAEFESHDFHVEKVVQGHGRIVLFIGPLAAGQYGFFDDFHKSTTTGTLAVK